MRRLSEDEFRATYDAHPVAVEQDDEPPFDFWPYFDAIPNEDCNGHDFSEGAVTHAWTMPISNFQHVLVRCDTPNVFLVLVLDLPRGHRHMRAAMPGLCVICAVHAPAPQIECPLSRYRSS